MELDQLEAFLTVAEELHFGRAAERLYLSQPRVSRLIASLESEVGGRLFERTSRRVSLTPLGGQLEKSLRPAYTQMRDALEQARLAARGIAGRLRIGITATTEGEAVTRLIEAFEAANDDCDLTVGESDIGHPYARLRAGEFDVLINWVDALAIDEPDLTAGPIIDRLPRVLAVAATHPFAGRSSVSVEDLALCEVARMPPAFPKALSEIISPSRTPSGRPVPRGQEVSQWHETVSLIALGRIVHPTVRSRPLLRDDIRLIPISDMPPMSLGLIWRTAHANARILAFAEAARELASRELRSSTPPASPRVHRSRSGTARRAVRGAPAIGAG